MKVGVRLATISFAMACVLANAPVRAAEYTLKWAVVTRGDMQEKFGHKLAEVLPKATNGRVEVKVFPGGQLGNPQALIEGVQLGTVEAYENPADFFSGVDARFGVFSIPFLFRDTAQANKVLADPEFNAYCMKMAEAKGLVGVNLAVAAESLYFGAKKPLRTLADFKGLKLRVNATPAERARMAALGATAVPMGLPEMITSLQNGVIDGTMSGISIYTNFNLQNVGKVLTETHDTLLISYGCHEQSLARQAAARSRARSLSTKRASCSRGRARPRSTRSLSCARSGSIAAARSSRCRRPTRPSWRSGSSRSVPKSPRTIRS